MGILWFLRNKDKKESSYIIQYFFVLGNIYMDFGNNVADSLQFNCAAESYFGSRATSGL